MIRFWEHSYWFGGTFLANLHFQEAKVELAGHNINIDINWHVNSERDLNQTLPKTLPKIFHMAKIYFIYSGTYTTSGSLTSLEYHISKTCFVAYWIIMLCGLSLKAIYKKKDIKHPHTPCP